MVNSQTDIEKSKIWIDFGFGFDPLEKNTSGSEALGLYTRL